MKNTERFIAYPLLCLGLVYCIWAHNKLDAIHLSNRKPRIPSDTLNNLEADLIVQTSSPSYHASLIASRHPSLILPVRVTCTQYSIAPEDITPTQCTFRWSAWVHNPQPYWLSGAYFLEFRNSNNSLLRLIGPLPATFPSTNTPRKATSLCSLPAYLANQIDFSKSSIFILEKKLKIPNFSP